MIDNKKNDILNNKRSLISYSLYLALGSVAFFVFLTGVYTTYQAIIWKYTTKYITNSSVLTLVAFLSAVVLIGTCYSMVKSKRNVKMMGFFGCSIIVVYPFVIYILDIIMPYSSLYLITLSIPALIILIFTVFLWRKNKE